MHYKKVFIVKQLNSGYFFEMHHGKPFIKEHLCFPMHYKKSYKYYWEIII